MVDMGQKPRDKKENQGEVSPESKGRTIFQRGGMTIVSNTGERFIKVKVNGSTDAKRFSGTKTN